MKNLSPGSLALNALGSKAQSTPVANLNDDGKRQRWLTDGTVGK